MLHIRFVVVLAVLLSATNAFAQSAAYTVTSIDVSGNKRTKTAIILRELSIKVGDQLTVEELEAAKNESYNYLFNTTLFNSISIGSTLSKAGDSGTVAINITVVERWYLWPIPLFENAETNFNSWWQNQDFGRLEYGMYLTQHNLRGRNDRLRIILRQGFTEEYGIEYRPTWIDKQQTLGMTAAVSYKRNREINTHSAENLRQFYEGDDYVRTEIVAGVELHQRTAYRNRHHYLLEYRQVSVEDTINDIRSDYLKWAKNDSRFLTFGYRFRRDSRDYINYPLKGYMLEVGVKKIGLGLIDPERINVLDFHGTYHHHFEVARNTFFAFGATGKTTVLDDPTYYLQQGLGYGATMIRGYELYVMDAQHYGLLRTSLKFKPFRGEGQSFRATILGQKIAQQFRLDVLFGGFFDAGYAVDNLYRTANPLSNEWHYGYGAGIDFVTIYDLVLRTELARNKLGENGFYLHFMKAI